MRVCLSLTVALMAISCSSNSSADSKFVRLDDLRIGGDIDTVILDDALRRLDPEERKTYDRYDETAGFYFEGQTKHCIVIVVLRRGVLIHRPSPAFCYDKTTNKFLDRL
ncbi:hypothetical protein GCM10010833_29930 [Blastomonas aquatica]|uniref:Lipoprotein SmpA/OmlA domain-containing protein n=1 Tax=Blastomonas aquatica TaxID=1510276 RepID=A0ABQ1JQT6_9SPHN|nr:hypothetical protein GCM10010833_29930 [Blastomonas aquatica]